MLHNRASSNAIINKIMSNAKGIGESKAEAKRNSNIIGQNGQKVSSKAHSISSTQNLRSVTTQYVNFVKEEYAGKTLANINDESMKAFIDFKIDQGLSLSSANTYISELGKVSDNLNQLNHNQTNRENITSFRSELKEVHGTLQSPNIDRTNSNTEAILNEMRNTPYSLSSELQANAGLRADDALNVDKLIINQDNSINVIGSKNGLNYTTSIQSQELINKLSEAKENGYRANYSEYREALKEAVQNTEQDFKGTHSLRYDYANNTHDLNISKGMTESESKSEISLNMGHSREEITETYLKP